MKRIRGLSGPTPGLQRFCASLDQSKTWDEFGSFEAGNAKKELATELESTQHGLCAYCETKLIQDERQVEHFVPRSDPTHGKRLMFSHDNVFACCKGGTNRNFAVDALNKPEYYLEPRRDNRSCGEAKGKMPFTTFIDPRNVPSLATYITRRCCWSHKSCGK